MIGFSPGFPRTFRSSMKLVARSAFLLVLFFLCPAHAVEGEALILAPGPEDVVRHRFDGLRKRILARVGEPGVASDLYELRDLLTEGGSLERASDLLGRVVSSWRAAPEVKALARRILADVERMRGRIPRMAVQLQALGVVTDVSVIGPFSDENREGWDRAYGPEKGGDLAAAHEGLRSQVRWRPIRGLGRTGRIALHEAIPSDGEVVAYLLTDLRAPRDVQATLHLGTPGATKAWISGVPVLDSPDYHPARFDQRSVPISLRKGSNFLLLKVASGGGGPFAVDLRVEGSGGGAIPGLVAVAPSAGSHPPARRSPSRIRGRSTLVEELARLAKGGSPRTVEDWARVSGERHPFDSKSKAHVRAASRAAELAPQGVEAQLLAARYQVEDANEKRRFLQRAVAAEPPGEARAHAALAEHWLSRGQPWRAIELLESRLASAPGAWPAGVILARAWDVVGEPSAARRIVEALAERHPDESRIHAELARYARRDGDVGEAIRRWRVALALRPADATSAHLLAAALFDGGQAREADEVLASIARMSPLDVSLLAWRGEALAANGSVEEGRLLFREALSVASQDPRIWERLGEMELARGDEDEALEALREALRLSPQHARLRQLVSTLEREGSSLSAFLRDPAELMARLEASFPGEDAVRAEVQVVRVLPSGQTSRIQQSVVHVRSRKGVERFRTFPVRYAPGREELEVERARILRSDGSVEHTYGESERSMNDAASGIYYDARLRSISFPTLRQGDTVELVYRIDDVARENLLSDYFGDFQLAQDTVPILHWDYFLEMPQGREIHASEPEGATHVVRATAQGALHHWSLTDVPRLVAEPRMPGWSEVARHLHVSTYADWDSVARYWWGLVRDQVVPTPEIERVAKEIVAGIPPSKPAARVEAIHSFVVEKTRYVGLELGIHSFKPYEVTQVLKRGFGDCKDKASLTHALLRAVGIDSRLVLLRMRHLGRVAEAPASLAVFNHAILYVPSLDLYLDGTAEWSGSKELPEADRGAEILIVHPDGRGERRRTEEAPVELTTSSSRLRIFLEEDGSGTVEGGSEITGLAAPRYRRAYASENRRLGTLERSWASTFPGAHARKLEMSPVRRLEERVELSFELEVPSLAERLPSGGLAILPLGRSSGHLSSYAPLSSRKFDLLLQHPWTDRLTVEIGVPEGMEVEELPPSREEHSPFGSFSVHYGVEGGKILVRRELILSSTRIAPAEYPAFREFLARVDALEARRIHLSKSSELAVSG